MTVQLNLDFGKETLSRTVLDILRNGLKDDPKSKLSYEECLQTAAQGKKLQYGAANHLLIGILRALYMEDSQTGDEYQPRERPEEIDLGKDLSMSQTLTNANSPEQSDEPTEDGPKDANPTQSTSAATLSDSAQKSSPNQNSNAESGKKKELCRYYARGHCTRKKECRFDHPSICQKFHKFGSLSSDPKGCDGKCRAFHPNACRSSLRNKTCSWDECRFYHLKGTNRTSSQNQNQNNSRTPNQNSNWNTNKKRKDGPNQQQNRNQNAGKNQGKSKSGENQRKNQNQNRDGATGIQNEQVFQKDKAQLNTTLEAIMSRLMAMEMRQNSIAQSHGQTQHCQINQVQPLLSPAVRQPSTQTQNQWASQNQWTQSQSQPQY